jgi:hypothetical protein
MLRPLIHIAHHERESHNLALVGLIPRARRFRRIRPPQKYSFGEVAFRAILITAASNMPSAFMTAVKSAHTIEYFVINGDLSAELNRSADSDVKAASLALRNMDIARDPQREVTLAVGHLQSAHVKLREAWGALSNIAARNLRSKPFINSVRLDTWVCCVLSICYLYLKEPALVKQSIQSAQDSMAHDPGYHLGWGKVAEIVGLSYMSLAGLLFDIGSPWIDDSFTFQDEEFDSFCQSVNSLAAGL